MNLVVVNENKMRRASVQPKMPLIEATVGGWVGGCDGEAVGGVLLWASSVVAPHTR